MADDISTTMRVIVNHCVRNWRLAHLQPPTTRRRSLPDADKLITGGGVEVLDLRFAIERNGYGEGGGGSGGHSPGHRRLPIKLVLAGGFGSTSSGRGERVRSVEAVLSGSDLTARGGSGCTLRHRTEEE